MPGACGYVGHWIRIQRGKTVKNMILSSVGGYNREARVKRTLAIRQGCYVMLEQQNFLFWSLLLVLNFLESAHLRQVADGGVVVLRWYRHRRKRWQMARSGVRRCSWRKRGLPSCWTSNIREREIECLKSLRKYSSS